MDKAVLVAGLSKLSPLEKLIALKHLKSGDEWIYTDVTLTGNPIKFETQFAQTAKDVSVTFTPKQSFNGYSQPWAAAAGRNKWPFGDVDTEQSTPIAFTYPIPAGTYFLSCESFARPWAVQFYYQGGGEVIASPGAEITFADTVVSATWGAPRFTITNIQLEPGEYESEFEPYSNICTISKYAEISVERSGVNYFTALTGSRTVDGITATVNGSGIFLNGTATQNAFFEFSVLVPPGEYYFSGSPSGISGNVMTSILDVSTGQPAMQWDGVTPCVDDGTSKNNQFLSVEGCQYEYIIGVREGFTCDNVYVYPMIRLPEEDQTVSVELTSGGDVYGGTLDMTTGVLTVKSRVAKFSLFGVGNYTSIDTKYIDTLGMIKAWIYAKVGSSVPYKDISKGYCNILKCDFIEGGHPLSNSDALWSQGAPNTIGNTSAYPYSLFYYIPYGGPNGVQEATTAAIKQWFVDNNAEIVYELETPVTYQLTPAQLELLEGSNTVQMDSVGASNIITLTYQTCTKG